MSKISFFAKDSKLDMVNPSKKNSENNCKTFFAIFPCWIIIVFYTKNKSTTPSTNIVSIWSA